jgi:hypothetical protein
MSVQRSLLIRGPAKATFDGATFYTEDDILCPIEPSLAPLDVSALGVVDQIWTDLVINIALRPYGAWQDLAVLFPPTVLNPTPGTSLFSGADKPLAITGRNGDQITFHNARLTQLAELFLGVNAPVFSGALQFTCLLKDNTEPNAANAYYTIGAGAYGDDAAFSTSLANYKRQAYSAAWSGKTGFSAFQGDQGVNIAWQLGLVNHVNSNLGTIDVVIKDMVATARCIPLQPTLAQIETAAAFQGRALGSRLGSTAGDLVFSGSGVSVTLKKAAMTRWAPAFGVTPLRVGEVGWTTNRGITAGVADAVAAVA